MRRLVLAAAMVGTAFGAHAADFSDLPVLRGSVGPAPLSSTTVNWDGWYAGGQVGYTAADVDFTRSVVSLTNYIFRNSILQGPTSDWSLLTKNHMQAWSVGAFVGRNWQWDDLVFGFEANYNYFNNARSSSTGTMALGGVAGTNPPPNHTYTYYTSMTGAAELQVKDVVTLRSRAGWAAGNFMPYVFGGLAVGRMQVARSVSTTVTLRDDEVVTTVDPFGNVTTVALPPAYYSVPSLSQTNAETRINSFVGGWTGGLGVEYMLWGSVFVRGEWEYIKFLKVKETNVSMNNVRFGVGYKF